AAGGTERAGVWRRFDVFQDREERVAQAAQQHSALLQEHSSVLQWLRREPAIYAVWPGARARPQSGEWVAVSDFRFLPTIPDETFGYILHPVDLARNKVAAVCGRRA